ncbi:MAG: hypothetical protein R3222_06365 [Balneolaceae bacterium]|nr:hypothetical protein [Balneolaceae bacterium]
MKNIIANLLIVLVCISCTSSPYSGKQLTIVGTIHFPNEVINADTLYKAILDAEPDVILIERDSSAFDEDFNRTYESQGNEAQAITKYLKDRPQTLLRPIEFEGRDTFRFQTGLHTQANPVYSKLQELNVNDELTPEDQASMNAFINHWGKLSSLSKESLYALNNDSADAILDTAKHYQYVVSKEMVNRYDAFDSMMVDSKGDSVSLRNYFDKWTQFEHYDRQDAMVANIKRTIADLPQSNFLVLVGYHHRYYIKKKLQQQVPAIKLVEYYE